MKPVDNLDNYNLVAKFLHWTIAFLIIGNYIMGLTLDNTNWYVLHKQIGLTIILLVVLRIIWRIASKFPKPLSTISRSETFVALSGQIILYFLMLAVPVSGILMVEASGYPLVLYGLIKLPVIISKQTPDLVNIKLAWHLWLAHTIIIVAAAHALIALLHHYIIKDRLLVRMLPWCKR